MLEKTILKFNKSLCQEWLPKVEATFPDYEVFLDLSNGFSNYAGYENVITLVNTEVKNSGIRVTLIALKRRGSSSIRYFYIKPLSRNKIFYTNTKFYISLLTSIDEVIENIKKDLSYE